jgi:psiF repeat
LNIRIVSLVCAGAFCLIAPETLLTFGALAQITTARLVDASSAGGDSLATVRLVAETLPAAKQDPAERSARSIECAQKAEAQGLQGRTRKHFLRECKQGS